jgi:hypothetical protein
VQVCTCQGQAGCWCGASIVTSSHRQTSHWHAPVRVLPPESSRVAAHFYRRRTAHGAAAEQAAAAPCGRAVYGCLYSYSVYSSLQLYCVDRTSSIQECWSTSSRYSSTGIEYKITMADGNKQKQPAAATAYAVQQRATTVLIRPYSCGGRSIERGSD